MSASSAPWDDWDELINTNNEFWENKLTSVLHIDATHESDYNHGYDRHGRKDYETIFQNRWRRKLKSYRSVSSRSHKLLKKKLKASNTTQHRLSHLVTFIPIFEEFHDAFIGDLDGGDFPVSYDYEITSFRSLLIKQELTAQEKAFVLQTIDEVIPFEQCCEEDPFRLKYDIDSISEISEYVVLGINAKSSQGILNKFNDIVSLNKTFWISEFFRIEEHIFSKRFGSITKFMQFLNESNITNKIIVDDDWIFDDVMYRFKVSKNINDSDQKEEDLNNKCWKQSFIDWISKRFENCEDIELKVKLINNLVVSQEDSCDESEEIRMDILCKMLDEFDDDTFKEMNINLLQCLASKLLKNGFIDKLMVIMNVISDELDIAKLISFINWKEHIFKNREEFDENMKIICLRILQSQSDEILFCVDTLHNLCDFASLPFVTTIFNEHLEKTKQHHLKCIFLNKCYGLQCVDEFSLYLKTMHVFKSHVMEFQVLSETLKCIRNNLNECHDIFEEEVIKMFVDSISMSYTDTFIKKLLIEISDSRQIAEHFRNSLCALSFLNKVVIESSIIHKCDELKQFCISIWNQCNTFWGDRKLTKGQKQQISAEITEIKSYFDIESHS